MLLWRRRGRRSKLKERRRRIRLIVLGVSSFLVVVLLLFFGNLEPLLIQTIRVEGTTTIEPRAVKEDISTILDERTLLAFSGRHALWYDASRLARTLRSSYPSIREVAFDVDNFDTLKVTISERTKAYTWCRQQHHRDCYHADENGVVYRRATSTREVVIYDERATSSPELGRSVLENHEISVINDYRRFFDQEDLTYGHTTITAEEDFFVTTESGVTIRSDGNDIRDEIANVYSLVRSQEFEDEGLTIGDGFSRIDYIDVRFGNRLYYTLKE